MVGFEEQHLGNHGTMAPAAVIKDSGGVKAAVTPRTTPKLGSVGPLVFALNGARMEVSPGDLDLRMTLSQYLRSHGYRGTKVACAEGGCGACAVVISSPSTKGKTMAVNSCLKPLGSLHGWAVTTIEGIGSATCGGGKVHPIQERLADYHGSQCGFCTPGMVASIYSQLHNADGGAETDRQTVAGALDGNICRCTGYRPIVDAAASFTPSADQQQQPSGASSSSDIEDLGRGPCGAYEVDSHDHAVPAFLSDVTSSSSITVLESSDGTMWFQPTTLTQLGQIRQAYPGARLLGGNTAWGLYKGEGDDDDDDAAAEAEEAVVICLGDVKEMHGFVMGSDRWIAVGTATTLSSFITSLTELQQTSQAVVLEPLVVHLRRIAGTLVRNSATLGGNLYLSRTKDLESDLATLLVGLGAVVTLVQGKNSNNNEQEQEMPLVEYLNADSERVAPGLMLVKIRFPLSMVPVDNGGKDSTITEVFRSYRVSMRHSNSHALVNAAFRASVEVQSSTIKTIVLSVGAMGSPTVRASKTEAVLVGAKVEQATLEAALLEMRKEIVPTVKTRYRYRLELLSTFLYKFFLSIKAALQQQQGGSSLDTRLLSAAEAPTERSVFQGRSRYSKPASSASGTSKRVHQPICKDSKQLQVTGGASYLADMKEVEGTLHGAYVKSPRAVGVLASLTVDKALAYPGVHRIITAEHVPGVNDAGFYLGPPDVVPDYIFVPIGGRVAFHSQPLAIVLADTAEHAREAAKLVEVKFDGFEAPVVTIGDAREAKSFMGISDEVKRGDAVGTLAQARVRSTTEGVKVVKGTVKGGSQKHLYLETQAAYAIPDEDRMVVWSSTQGPECVQKVVATALSVSMHDIQVKHRRAGGAFGAKATRNLPHAAAAAVAAKVTSRPVRVVLDWETDMQLTGGRHEVEADYEVAFDPSTGKVDALKVDIFLNGGFCADLSFTPCHDMALNLEQAYYIPHMHANIQVMRTNQPTRTAMRAPGVIQASLVMETIIDHVAREAALSPEKVRQTNFFTEQSNAMTGCKHMPSSPLSHFTLPKIWDDLSTTSNLAARRESVSAFNAQHRWRKRGLAMTPIKFFSGLMPMHAMVNIYKDGSVLIHHAGCEIGQGIHVKSSQVAVDVLSSIADDGPLSLSLIRFADTNTDVLPNGGYTAASTTSERACAAVEMACQELVKRLQPIKEGMLAKNKATAVSWKSLVEKATDMFTDVDLCAHVQYRPSVAYYHNYGAALSEVEVDCLTGEVQVMAAHVMYDCGKSLNPAIDIGQVEGAFVQGLGYYLMEEAQVASDGTLQSKGTWTYKPPMAWDLPQDWKVDLFENPNFDKGFLSSKASGEPPLILATSVFMAIRDAVAAARAELGLPVTALALQAPATVDRVHRACGTSLAWMRLDGQRSPWLDEKPVMEVEVAVAGAGLGGLAMGIALKNRGVDGHLFEKAPALRDVSQGLVGITPNGLRALELIDPRLKTYLFEKGKYNTEAFTKTIDQEGSSERIVTFEANNLSIPWADIQHSLARLVPKDMIHCNYDYAGCEEDDEGVTVYFKGRLDTVRAKMLIGVDGLFSSVRKSVAPFPDSGGDEVGESGHTNWNAIMSPGDAGLPYPHPVVSLTYNKSDPPRFFFLIECGNGRILWQVRVDDPAKQYTVAPKKGHGRLGLKGVKQRILDMISDVPDVYPYIAATPEENIFERCLLFRKMLLRYSSPGRRVVLVGDAAHAMHSVRGQGANMTFEDAHHLGLALSARGVGPQAVRLYERVRIPRANMVQWESNTYYKKQFEKNTSMEWKFKFLNFQKYVMEVPEELPAHELAIGDDS